MDGPIGKESGVCNADFTDCDCSDNFVTPKQYGLCAVDTICNLRCMKKGFARYVFLTSIHQSIFTNPRIFY